LSIIPDYQHTTLWQEQGCGHCETKNVFYD
jgi:hypothetical protein